MNFKNKYLIKIFTVILLCSFLIFPLSALSAEGKYYSDVEITVDSSGFVTIKGVTNHPDLLVENTERYTSKKQSYWLLNITKDEVFSSFVYVLSLPAGSSINYVKSSEFRIETSNGNLIVTGFGENKPFSIVVQYQIQKTSETSSILNFDMIIYIFLICIIIFVVIILFFKKSKQKEASFKGYTLKGLNERQRNIMKLLIERKTPLTQTDIQKELKIPKAAVSRNIRGLEIKGLIEKEQIGMSNLIRLKKP